DGLEPPKRTIVETGDDLVARLMVDDHGAHDSIRAIDCGRRRRRSSRSLVTRREAVVGPPLNILRVIPGDDRRAQHRCGIGTPYRADRDSAKIVVAVDVAFRGGIVIERRERLRFKLSQPRERSGDTRKLAAQTALFDANDGTPSVAIAPVDLPSGLFGRDDKNPGRVPVVVVADLRGVARWKGHTPHSPQSIPDGQDAQPVEVLARV